LRFFRRYKHGFIVLFYAVFYMICFYALEQRSDVEFHIIHTPLDDYIPFCEYFIVPYIFWFVYMFIAILFFIFINPNKREYYQMILSLGTGMTLFLLISYLYPNGLNLRPQNLVHGNLFTDVVILLYSHDSPTNVFPSIHVFNSLAIHTAIARSRMLDQDRWIKWASFVLTVAIIASTLFLKQHSVLDVIGGIVLAIITYLIFYKSRLVSRLPS
jgi:membrane-associated phospholipid phosphatase